MIADGNAELTEALGLNVDLTKNGMGKARSRRYSEGEE
jgi:peroxiredoxin